METKQNINQAKLHLQEICNYASGRNVGTLANQRAAVYITTSLLKSGFMVETPSFTCIDWEGEGASLRVGGEEFSIFASPFSNGCKLKAPLMVAGKLEELEAFGNLSSQVLLLHGELTREQLAPRNFKFYNPEEHQHIYHLLDVARPLAILAATGRNPETAGAVYPFPLIEDGDFEIPNTYMTEEEGEKLLKWTGQAVELEIQAKRRPSSGCNVSARKGAGEQRLLFFAHLDTKIGTPGALDNAAGVVSLLLLAELMADYDGKFQIEITLLNGEDNYASPGELLWMGQNEGQLGDIELGINLDANGFIEGQTAYSLYGCSPELTGQVQHVFGEFPGLKEGEPWYQSDHSILLQNGVPAMAITSDLFAQLCAEITHTEKDTVELVDVEKLVETARALKELIDRL
jgi:aminopeptidase YwaD